MDRKLHLLESFTAQGTDGLTYKVFGFEHMVRDESLTSAFDQWEPTGVSEYRLADGRRVDVKTDGSVRVVDTREANAA